MTTPTAPHTPPDTPVPAVDGADAARALRPVCGSDTWLDTVLAGRPFASLQHLIDCSDAAVAALPWAELEAALSAHPRIGERIVEDTVEARWSADEQSRASAADDAVAAALREGNLAYERRFGHVFLICARDRTGEDILAELRRRTWNEPVLERQVVRDELAAIIRSRLARLFGPA